MTTTLDRIRAGQRDSRIAAADIVAREHEAATVAVAQGCAQRRGRERVRLPETMAEVLREQRKRSRLPKRQRRRTRVLVALAALLLLGLSACGHCEDSDQPGSRWCLET